MLSYNENPQSLSHLGLVQNRTVTDGQTDRITTASMHLPLSALALQTKISATMLSYRDKVAILFSALLKFHLIIIPG